MLNEMSSSTSLDPSPVPPALATSLPDKSSVLLMVMNVSSVIDTQLNVSSSKNHLMPDVNQNNDQDTICMTWHQCGLFIAFILLIVVTLIGNTLVIMAVLTTRRLRTVTNCFVMSLALADWLVGTFVMPPAVSLFIAGKCVITIFLFSFINIIIVMMSLCSI